MVTVNGVKLSVFGILTTIACVLVHHTCVGEGETDTNQLNWFPANVSFQETVTHSLLEDCRGLLEPTKCVEESSGACTWLTVSELLQYNRGTCQLINSVDECDPAPACTWKITRAGKQRCKLKHRLAKRLKNGRAFPYSSDGGTCIPDVHPTTGLIGGSVGFPIHCCKGGDDYDQCDLKFHAGHDHGGSENREYDDDDWEYRDWIYDECQNKVDQPGAGCKQIYGGQKTPCCCGNNKVGAYYPISWGGGHCH